jgi:predicted nucleic acid-binding protein
MIFVDTSAWFAAVVPTDSDHPHATRWLAANSEQLLTTDYVIDETLTLLRARGERQRAKVLGKQFFESSMTEVLTEAIDEPHQFQPAYLTPRDPMLQSQYRRSFHTSY